MATLSVLTFVSTDSVAGSWRDLSGAGELCLLDCQPLYTTIALGPFIGLRPRLRSALFVWTIYRILGS
jgi:hypothetical protein